MKKLYLALALASLSATLAFAQDGPVVRWRQIVGVITAPGVDNPVGGFLVNNTATNQIHSGAGPWTAKGGSVRINLQTGEGSFDVDGLVLNGGNSTGTPGAVSSVMGTLVCDAGTPQQVILDTPAAALSSAGDAELSFRLSVPSQCDNPVFLIRVPAGRWIGAAAIRTISQERGGY
jgi:hypothetical protein